MRRMDVNISYFKLVLSYGEHDLNHVLDPRGCLPGVKNRPQRLKHGVDASRAHFNQLQTNLLYTCRNKK